MRKVSLTAVSLVAVATNVWAIEPGLYGVQSGNDGQNGLFRIDPATGAATKLTSLDKDPSICGASFLHGELYVTDVLNWVPGTGYLLYNRLDTDTGIFAGIHDQGFDFNWHGLASSDSLGVTWAIGQDTNRSLIRTDAAGNMTVIGPTGIDGNGMAYDDLHGILYATNYEDSGLYSIDINTGAATYIGNTGVRCDLVGLAYDEWTQTLYLNEADVTDSLYTVDVATGQATLVGANNFPWIDGLAWIPEPSSLTLVAVALLGASLRRR
ncbi:MAG: PEP-CTERM sorting domain-containing protein [Phycisphaerae bacterium]|mgnify:CR=1 FL=1|nr:PEP-CTERM sorting domain-containing protein [Phycisphaerae bacterium]